MRLWSALRNPARQPHPQHLSELFAAQDQTIAYWGFAREALAAWVGRLPDRAIDRIVPLGQALRFADRWDGHDLLLAFSRQVVIE